MDSDHAAKDQKISKGGWIIEDKTHLERVEDAIERSKDCLFKARDEGGYWL